MKRLAVLGGEDVDRVTPGRAQRQPFGCLPGTMGPQDVDRHRVERHHAATVVLGPGDGCGPANLDDLPLDGQRSGLQIDVSPRQPDALTPAQPSEDEQVVIGVEPVSGYEVEKRPDLLRPPHRHLGPATGGQPLDDPLLGPQHWLGPRRRVDLHEQGGVVHDAVLPLGRVERCAQGGVDARQGRRTDWPRGLGGGGHDGVVGTADVAGPQLLQVNVAQVRLEPLLDVPGVRAAGIGGQLALGSQPLVQPLPDALPQGERQPRAEPPLRLGEVRQPLEAAVVLADGRQDVEPSGVVVGLGDGEQPDGLVEFVGGLALGGEAPSGELLAAVLLPACVRQRQIHDVRPGAVLLGAGKLPTDRVEAGPALAALIGGALHGLPSSRTLRSPGSPPPSDRLPVQSATRG
nr:MULTISPECIES: hypothetical protein [Streptomyces]